MAIPIRIAVTYLDYWPNNRPNFIEYPYKVIEKTIVAKTDTNCLYHTVVAGYFYTCFTVYSPSYRRVGMTPTWREELLTLSR